MIRRRTSYVGFGTIGGGGGVEEKKEDDNDNNNGSYESGGVRYTTTKTTHHGMAQYPSCSLPPPPPPLTSSYYNTHPNHHVSTTNTYLDEEQQYHDRNDNDNDNNNANNNYNTDGAGRYYQHSTSNDEQRDFPDTTGNGNTFQSHVESLAKVLFGSCSVLIHNCSGGYWPNNNRTTNTPEDIFRCCGGDPSSKAPLSITDELRQLAIKEGRVFHSTGGPMMRTRKASTTFVPVAAMGGVAAPAAPPDIPKYLGEQAVYSFEDDNISAISQNTLEEMARHGLRYPIIRRIPTEDISTISGMSSTIQCSSAASTTTNNTTTTPSPPDYEQQLLQDELEPANHNEQQQQQPRRHVKKSKSKKKQDRRNRQQQSLPPPVPESHLEDLTMMSSSSPL